MANEQNNPIVLANEKEVVGEGNMLVGDLITLQSFRSIQYCLPTVWAA